MTCSIKRKRATRARKDSMESLVEFLGDDNFLDDNKFKMMCAGGKSADAVALERRMLNSMPI
jgi:hypothetical protein